MTFHCNYFHQYLLDLHGKVNRGLSLQCVFLCYVANGSAEQGEDSKVPEGKSTKDISSQKPEDGRKNSVSEVLYKVSLVLFKFLFTRSSQMVWIPSKL